MCLGLTFSRKENLFYFHTVLQYKTHRGNLKCSTEVRLKVWINPPAKLQLLLKRWSYTYIQTEFLTSETHRLVLLCPVWQLF